MHQDSKFWQTSTIYLSCLTTRVCDSSSSLIRNLSSYLHSALIRATGRPRPQIDPAYETADIWLQQWWNSGLNEDDKINLCIPSDRSSRGPLLLHDLLSTSTPLMWLRLTLTARFHMHRAGYWWAELWGDNLKFSATWVSRWCWANSRVASFCRGQSPFKTNSRVTQGPLSRIRLGLSYNNTT